MKGGGEVGVGVCFWGVGFGVFGVEVLILGKGVKMIKVLGFDS